MDTNALIQGLIMFVAFIPLVTLHEFAHAWVAGLCGDDTPRLQGRVTLDPTAHIDPLGTIIVPLIAAFLGAASGSVLLFGWGRPVLVNLSNFRNRRRDDILVSGAGPLMNLVAAVALLGLMKVLQLSGVNHEHLDTVFRIARLSVFLCFFNLLPVPPLDGGHIMRNVVGMTEETYRVLSQYSFMFLIIIMRVPAIGYFVSEITNSTLGLLARPFGWYLTSS